jgi:hypothetical protein
MFRSLCCSLLLAGLAFAQSSQQSPLGSQQQSGLGGSSQSSQNPDPLQSQQNPLTAAPRSTDPNSTTPKTTFDVGTSSTGGQDQELGEVRMMLRNTDIGGDASQSFLTGGANDLAEFNWFQDKRFDETRRYQVLTMFRGTNDDSIDPERLSIQKAFLRIYGPNDEYIFGDALENFSRLSLQQNIKGVSAAWKFNKQWKLSLTEGVYIDRYGSLYKDLIAAPYMAWVGGARLEYKIDKSAIVGFNFVSSDDRISSLPIQPVGFAPWPSSNRVGTVDGKFNFKGLRLDAEYAYSITDFDTRQSSNCELACDSRQPEPELGDQGDWAGRLEGIYRYKKLTFRGSYARYEPNFASMEAMQIPDLQDAVFRASYEVTDKITLDGTVRRSNDDLKKQLPFETTLLGPEAKVSFHNFDFYPRGIVDVGYRYEQDLASDRSINRTLGAPFIEFTVPYHATYFSIGYERRDVTDYVIYGETSNTNRVYVALRGIYDFGGWHVNPVMRFELEREAHRPDEPVDPTLAYDSNRLNSIGFFIESPKWFITELAYRNSSATIYAMNGFDRPSYKAALTYKIMNNENTQLIFSFERNNNYFANLLPYDERQYGVTFDWKFGKRAKR